MMSVWKSFLKNKFFFLGLALVTCLVINSLPLRAYPKGHLRQVAKKRYIACIDSFSGKVKVYVSVKKKWVKAKRDLFLEEKDIIKTGKRSYCRIILEDGTLLRIGAKTELHLEILKLTKIKKKKVQNYKFGLRSGRFLGTFNKRGSARARMSVRTPTALAGIRGTDFAVQATTSECTIGLFEGELSIKNITPEGVPSDEETILTPDKEAKIESGKRATVTDYLSRAMEKEKKRCAKLREYAERIRKRLDERETYLQERIDRQKSRLDKWEQKRKEKIEKRIRPKKKTPEEKKIEEETPEEKKSEEKTPEEKPTEEKKEEK